MIYTATPASFSPKTPSDSLPFGFDLSLWLTYDSVTGQQDTIQSATMTASPAGLVIGTVTVASPFVTATISGGVAGTDYTITLLAETAAGMSVQADEVLSVAVSVR